MTASLPVKTARLKRRETVFVCGKCLKRCENGKAIRKAMRARAKAADTKLVRTTCFGLCPKQAVVVVTRASLTDGRAVILKDISMIDEVFADRIASDG